MLAVRVLAKLQGPRKGVFALSGRPAPSPPNYDIGLKVVRLIVPTRRTAGGVRWNAPQQCSGLSVILRNVEELSSKLGELVLRLASLGAVIPPYPESGYLLDFLGGSVGSLVLKGQFQPPF